MYITENKQITLNKDRHKYQYL